MTDPIGVLVMAYGSASGPEDIERYYTDIRGGRPPSPEHLTALRQRYAAIANRSPERAWPRASVQSHASPYERRPTAERRLTSTDAFPSQSWRM